jgi:phage tail protein X
MAGYTTYTTNQGDTWTGIAWKAYGDVSKMDSIMAANPYIPASALLSGGVDIRVPILEKPSFNPSMLPPWKR